MSKTAFLGPVAALACLASAASADGPIGTLRRGTYLCELPGDASGPAGIVQTGAGFVVESSSRYLTSRGGGTYLRRGSEFAMTSGPMQGDRYRIISDGFVRRIENGRPGRLRCVLRLS